MHEHVQRTQKNTNLICALAQLEKEPPRGIGRVKLRLFHLKLLIN